jgi:hypothetical protein
MRIVDTLALLVSVCKETPVTAKPVTQSETLKVENSTDAGNVLIGTGFGNPATTCVTPAPAPRAQLLKEP